MTSKPNTTVEALFTVRAVTTSPPRVIALVILTATARETLPS